MEQDGVNLAELQLLVTRTPTVTLSGGSCSSSARVVNMVVVLVVHLGWVVMLDGWWRSRRFPRFGSIVTPTTAPDHSHHFPRAALLPEHVVHQVLHSEDEGGEHALDDEEDDPSPNSGQESGSRGNGDFYKKIKNRIVMKVRLVLKFFESHHRTEIACGSVVV